MATQTGKQISIAYKAESVFGTPVTGAGAEQFRPQGGPGGVLTRDTIEDPEIRKDGQRAQARLGPKRVQLNYPGTLSVATFNTFIAALFRNTFAATALKFTCDAGAAHTSLAITGQNTLTLVGTDTFTVTHGIKVGDVVRVGAMGVGADNVNAVVAAFDVTGKIITALGTPWTNFGADTNATFTVMKKVTNGATLTNTSFTVEEIFDGLDESEQFAGCRVSSMKLTFQPKAVVKVEFGLVGQDLKLLAGGSSPGFTSPTTYVSIGLVAVDALLSLAGAPIATITGGELTFDLNADGIDVVGSTLTPDIYPGVMKVTGSITAVRTALAASHLSRYLAETDNVEASLLFVEPGSTPPIGFVHVFLPRLKYLGLSKNLGDDGPIIETIPVYGAAKDPTTGYDAATATISTSA